MANYVPNHKHKPIYKAKNKVKMSNYKSADSDNNDKSDIHGKHFSKEENKTFASGKVIVSEKHNSALCKIL